jgi:LCP family protein required for cell wall assembly
MGKLSILLAAALSLAVLAVSSVGWATVSYFESSIKRVTVKPAGKRPAERPNDMNVLLIGSDSREGTGGEYGTQAEVGGLHSDTVIVAHLGADGSATLLSIPRDTLVPDPPDMKRNSSDGRDKFTDVLATGGINATISAVEDMTDLKIDHFIVIDLEGFKKMTDAVGGVTVCVAPLPNGATTNLNDNFSQWHGHLGNNKLNGDQALAFVRTRHALGDERLRIQRQQLFLSQLLKTATSAGVLTNPLKVADLISAVGSSLTVDSGLSRSAMIKLADRMRKISGGARFITLPTHIALPADGAVDEFGNIPPHGDVLIYDRAKAEPILAPLRPASENGPVGGASTASRPPLLPPAAVTVTQISNASGRTGLASRTRLALSDRGFVASGATTATATTNQISTQVRYPTGDAGAADTLVAAIPGATAVADPSLTSGLVVVLGSSFTGVSGPSAGGGAASGAAPAAGAATPAANGATPAASATKAAAAPPAPTVPPAPNCTP